MALPRLWIEYILIGLLIASAGLAVTVKMQSLRQEVKIENLSGKVEATETRLSVVEGVNEAQKQIIQGLADQRDLDGSSILRLMDKYQDLTLADRKLRNQLSNLEKNDEARSYLDTPVPNSVGCLWDDSCPSTSAGDPGGTTTGNAAPLLPAPKEEARSQP